MIQKPKVLILDESTSHLDAVTESKIREMLSKYRKNMTCIMIAHRLQTIKDCDKIVVMEKGHIAEEGSHDQLIKKHGKYYNLWQNQ